MMLCGAALIGSAWTPVDHSLDKGMKCPLAGTNKRFLINTIKNTLPSHKEQDHEQKEGSKEPGQSQDQKETNSKKHRSHSSKRSLHSARSSPPRKRASRDKRDSRASRR
ncbi:hypothetical protein U0070_025146 [Myodes glareolus]|uniref:Uncharacterized protein n=1 Tax=Myodes glareolus TaxID=447135 RepID=A0AAW0I7T2_MYOGA